MAGEVGESSSVSADQPVTVDRMDAMDRASMQQLEQQQPAPSVCRSDGSTVASEQALSQHMSAERNVQDRADKKAQLAQAMSAGTQMRVDPAEVEDLARFFEDEAQGLANRNADVRLLGFVEAPGTDPVSIGASDAYGRVGAGDERAYGDNYLKLIDVFKKTAESLRASAKQTRTDDQDSTDALKGKQ